MSANQMIDYKRFTLFCVCADHRNDLQPDARFVFGSHGTVNPAEFQLNGNTGGFQETFCCKVGLHCLVKQAQCGTCRRNQHRIRSAKMATLHVVDCNRVDQMPTLLMSFDDVRLDLHPRMYIQKDLVEGQMRCFSSIVPDPEIRTDHMTLGMAFMEQFIVMFDQREGKVGFKSRVC
ncbi:hypothetical protein X801_08264 [Opisthorchis viverrini]|uniref:Peptidase A1 domain-containing protein n=1 Tax=Opisthorchis viverrini TaxID=6198 RepID=A0A1S8WNH7_OPIVI|nr:hypothetical protein X801_08264 [Opisthorchis viverrini]